MGASTARTQLCVSLRHVDSELQLLAAWEYFITSFNSKLFQHRYKEYVPR